MESYNIRYVLARTALPKAPKILQSGRVSAHKQQDTSLNRYLDTCAALEQEPDEGMAAHLKERDRFTWVHSIDFPVTEEEAHDTTKELADVAKTMRSMKNKGTPPPRNLWACNSPYKCDWSELCHSNPEGDIENWWGIKANSYDGLATFEARRKKGSHAKIRLDRASTNMVSPSELRCFMTCPRKWHFEYVKLAERERMSYRSQGARFRGTLAHLSAELHALNKESDYIVYANQLVEDHWLEEEASTVEEDIIIGQAVGKKMFERATHDARTILHVEQRMAVIMPKSKVWLVNKPDLVTRTNSGEIMVIDYKTTSFTRLDRKAEEFRNNPALYLYAWALMKGSRAWEVTNV